MRASDRLTPIELDPEELRRLGHGLVDDIADYLRTGTPEYKTSAVRVEPLGGAIRPAAR
jgi:hypothetical protein